MTGSVVAIVLALCLTVYLRMRKKPRPCANCGAPSRFGFSDHAESDTKDVVRLCFTCLKSNLEVEYRQFAARALVVEPAANCPCYVFQPRSLGKDRPLMKETDVLLSKMEESCHLCGAPANFLWVTSRGLAESTPQKLFAEGVAGTLLQWGNAPPGAVCGSCSVSLICKSIESQDLAFLEVCCPRLEDGFVVPMGY